MQKVGDHIYLLVIMGMLGSFLLALTVVFFYIRSRYRLLRHRRQMQEAALQHQKDLLHAAIRSQEEERKRIGRDLHDDVGTALSSLRLAIQQMTHSSLETSPAASAGKYCKTLIDRTLNTVRHIAHNLSPPGLELFGFYDTVEELCETVTRSCSLLASVSSSTDILPSLDHFTSLALYRVIQELLTNTVKHAQARQARIVFSQEKDKLMIHYSDNGIGFDPSLTKGRGMGMQNIESRLGTIGATYSIVSHPGQGFNIHIELPPPNNIIYE